MPSKDHPRKRRRAGAGAEDIQSPTENEEKRVARLRSAPTADIAVRIERALSQRLYLIEQSDISSEEEGLQRRFAVLGSTGNVYEVIVGKRPHCSCPDCQRNHLCKHILFIMLKVLRLPADSYLIYQKALLQSELKTIFSNFANQRMSSTVSAKAEVVEAYRNSYKNTDNELNSSAVIDLSAEEDEKEEVIRTEPSEDCDCPICFERITITSCAGRKAGEAFETCLTCKNHVHRDCLLKWLERSSSCCFCRAPWTLGDSGETNKRKRSIENRFLNLGAIQGSSSHRDTSTYYGRR